MSYPNQDNESEISQESQSPELHGSPPKTLMRKISECDEFQLQELDPFDNSRQQKCSKIDEDAEGEEDDDMGQDAVQMRQFKESFSGKDGQFTDTYLVSNTMTVQGDIHQKTKFDQEFSPQKEPEFLIRDLDTGEVYDSPSSYETQKFDYSIVSRGSNTGSSFNMNTQMDSNNMLQNSSLDEGWKTFWSKVKKNNMNLLDYCETGDLQNLQILLDKNNTIPTQINFQGIDDWTGLHSASTARHANIVEFLLSNSANPYMLSQMKRTPLHSAVIAGSLECAKHLVKYGGKKLVDMQDKDFNTALHLATENDYEEMVSFLLQSQADSSLKNHKNITPYQLCISQEMKEVFHNNDISNSHSIQSDYGRLTVGGIVKRNSRSDQVAKLLLLAKTAKNCEIQNQADIINKKQRMIKEMKWTDFKFIRKLGAGSFGDVYLVEKDKQRFAMKVQFKEKVKAKNLERYVQTERNALSLFSHPFIIKLNFAFQNEFYLFMVMELAESGDMGQYMNTKCKLPEEEAKIYTAQIVLALEELHKHDIIFRDLKPDNVVLDRFGNAKLADFGLSKAGISNDTYTKSFCGSVAYLAPEILTKRPHSRTVDWYLLGTFLYELLVGIPPYYDNKREILFENIKKGPLKIPKSMSIEAKDLIKQLLNRNPKERLGSKNDSQDIKTHPFFNDLNWEELLAGKIKNPPIEMPKQNQKLSEGIIQVNFDRNPTPVKPKSPKIQQNSQPHEKIDKWTFIS